jgi:hypothetical protein
MFRIYYRSKFRYDNRPDPIQYMKTCWCWLDTAVVVWSGYKSVDGILLQRVPGSKWMFWQHSVQSLYWNCCWDLLVLVILYHVVSLTFLQSDLGAKITWVARFLPVHSQICVGGKALTSLSPVLLGWQGSYQSIPRFTWVARLLPVHSQCYLNGKAVTSSSPVLLGWQGSYQSIPALLGWQGSYQSIPRFTWVARQSIPSGTWMSKLLPVHLQSYLCGYALTISTPVLLLAGLNEWNRTDDNAKLTKISFPVFSGNQYI